MSKCVLAVLVMCCLFFQKSFAQSEFGGHITGQDWQILSSDAVRVIYPKGMDDRAQRIAHLINYMNENNRRSIGMQKRRIDMVLHNQTVVPNGYVALAPFRSEFFGTPPQSNVLVGSMDWLDVLAIHEYRHAQQNLNAKRGLTRLLYWLQGESMWSLAAGLSIPDWYSEGDAVITETALSNSGRGRSPFFTMEQRALALDGKNYRYAKHRNGSYKSLLPDQYRLGYMILTQTRNQFGNDITQKIHRDGASYRGIIYPFSRAMKRHTGYYTKGMYNLAWEQKKVDWASELKNTPLIPTTPVTPRHKQTVTSYRFPRPLADGSVVASKSSYKKTDELVLIANGKEKKLCTIGINYDEFISEGGGKFAWVEVAQDARRAFKGYSNIIVYDIKTDKRIQLTHKTRYFSPAFSPNGQSLATIFISANQENNILLLDPNSGNVLNKIPNPENYFLSRLTWTADGKALVSIAKHKGRIALVKFDLTNNTITELTPWSNHTMESPSVQGDKVFFNASYSGIDNIFYTDLRGSKQIFQATSVPVGAYEPVLSGDGKTLFFTEFTAMGYVISQQNIETGSQRVNAVTIAEPTEMSQFTTVANKTEGGSILEKAVGQPYISKSYKGLLHGQKLYGWGFSPSISNPGLSINMVNMLNDVKLDFGGNINRNEGNAKTYSANLEIARWYPAITLKAKQGARQTDYYLGGDTLSTQEFNETLFGSAVSIPLKWLKGNYSVAFTPFVGLNQRSLQNIKVESNFIPDNSFSTLNMGAHFSKVRRRAYQNVGARAGISVDIDYNKTISGTSNDRLWGKGKIYLPGIAANHNIEIKLAYQRELLANTYQFSDEYEYPRGYTSPVNDEFSSFSVNYGLPLFYPDFGIMGITYFKRIRANLFYDSGTGLNKRLDLKTNYRSAGFEVILDNKHLNFIQLSLGFRNSFLLDKDPRNPARKSQFTFFAVTSI